MKLYVMRGAYLFASHITLVWAGKPSEIVALSHQVAGGAAFRAVKPKGRSQR